MFKKLTLAALACCLVFSGCTNKTPDPVKEAELTGYQVDYEFIFEGNATKYLDFYVKYVDGNGKTVEEQVGTSPWKKSVNYSLSQKSASAVFTAKRNETPIPSDADLEKGVNLYCKDDCEAYGLYDDGTNRVEKSISFHGSGEVEWTGLYYDKIAEFAETAFSYEISVNF